MTIPTDQDINIQAIETESNALVVRANSYQITTNEVYVEAMEFAKTIKAMQKEVDLAFDSVIKQAHTTWKSAIAQKAKYYDPLEKALKFLDGKGRTFRAEQERIRQEEERKARELAEKETRRLQALAEKAAARGDEKKAEQFAERASETAAITPVVASKVSSVEGIKTRTVWKFEIVDEKLIPREYLCPDLVKIGQVVRATKNTLPIAGIKIFSEDSSI